MKCLIEIYNDDDFTLVGPGVLYHPHSGTFKHKIESDNFDDLKIQVVNWLLSLEVREPYDTESVYSQYDSDAGHGFRSHIYEAARAASHGLFYGCCGNREITVEFV